LKTREHLASLSAVLLCAAAAAATWGGTPRPIAPPPLAQSGAAGPCEKLAGLKLDDVDVVSATAQPDRAPVEGAAVGARGVSWMMPLPELPAFCRVVGRIHPEAGSDIGFEVWLPVKGWDGRLSGVGIGGFGGMIDYRSLSLIIKVGQAGVATDTGHTGAGQLDASWAKGHPQRVRDYGWRAVHLATVHAKQLVEAFYGRRADKSYFIGCSGGGRQGLIEASRFPDDYDGVLAGAPAASWTDVAIAMINAVQAQLPAGAAIRVDQMQLLESEVQRQCHPTDGLISDPRKCGFDVKRLECGTNSSAQCFSPAQTKALSRIQAGARDSAGRQLTGGYLPAGAESGPFGWATYLLTDASGAFGAQLHADGLTQNFIQDQFPTAAAFNFDTDPTRLKAELSGDLDVQPRLSKFFARGGKLILWHGWADPAIPPQATLDLDAAIHRNSSRAKNSERLFMVPNVQHCFGGNGPASFGQNNAPQPGDKPDNSMAAALQEWVEKGRAPDAITARFGLGLGGAPAVQPERQRLLCAYPRQAVLKSGAAPGSAVNYNCRIPSRN